MEMDFHVMVHVLCRYQYLIFYFPLYIHTGLAPDINECAVDNGGCEDNCTNTLGSFVCIHEPTVYTSTVENGMDLPLVKCLL